MALIKCPECGKNISDKAEACPNCGCPMEYESDNVIWHEDNVKERVILEAENNNTFTYIGIVLGVIWIAVIIISYTFPSPRILIWILFVFSVIIFMPLIVNISCRHLYFTNKKVVGDKGILLKVKMDVPLDMIASISVVQGVIGDTIIINTVSDRYIWKYINNATKFQQSLLHQVNVYKKNYR